MKKIVSEISNNFIKEAVSSPRMLEDLAAMEKYMSESYDGRTFVELIQNADDANATRIKVDYSGDTLIVANDGRSFDEKDIMAICRSGSSNKQRGANIGYRGVGFKCATTISTEIIIYSANTYFTFSKAHCAEVLGMLEDKVPTVRIPFLYDENKLNTCVLSKIEDIETDGFTTFFIFLNAKIEKFEEELSGFNTAWLLFLKKLSNISINLPSKNLACRVRRKNMETGTLVKIVGGKEQWYITEENGVSFAFKYDDDKGIQPCNAEEALFHCFLPTMDQTGLPFKVNADFSTDPSRKHIILDEITRSSFVKLGTLYVGFLKRITERQDRKMLLCLSLLNTRIALGDMGSRLESCIEDNLRKEKWLLKRSGEMTTPRNISYFPKWIEQEDKISLTGSIPLIANSIFDEEYYSEIGKMENLLSRLGAKELSDEILRNILLNVDVAKNVTHKFAAKLFAYCFRGLFSDKSRMDVVFIPSVVGYIQLCDIQNVKDIEPEFYMSLMSILNDKERDTLNNYYGVFDKSAKETSTIKKIDSMSMVPLPIKRMAINKWKSPVQNCLSVESLNGRTAKDVSRKCDEYNIESTDTRGERNYIVVKQVKSMGDSFSLSEKEYAAAQRLGTAYKVFVIAAESDDVQYTYISNPIDTVKLDKIVKEWEFICNTYAVPETEKKSDSDLLDQRFLKNLLPEYFNSVQRSFLLDFIASEKLPYEDSMTDVIEKINLVVDFYTGDKFLDVCEGYVVAEISKVNALKKIFKM